MKPPIHCKKPMELKAAYEFIYSNNARDARHVFHCRNPKCGEVEERSD